MRYTKIDVTVAKSAPFFIGSQIRGALGYALKKVTCINPAYSCEGCFASEDCLYFEFYEAKNQTHKYRLDIELGLENYRFALYLFDSAVDRLPYVVSALYQMLTKVGLGREKTLFDNFELTINNTNSYINGKITIPKEFQKTINIDTFCPDVTIELATPLRIKKHNRFIRSDDIELSDLIGSIYQRYQNLLGNGFGRFPHEIKGTVVAKTLEFKELVRKSNRQKTVMNMGGVMGKIEIKEQFEEELREYLK